MRQRLLRLLWRLRRSHKAGQKRSDSFHAISMSLGKRVDLWNGAHRDIVPPAMTTLLTFVLLVTGCGIVPIKPIVPIGCKDLRAECVCDASGQNCEWQWVCVK